MNFPNRALIREGKQVPQVTHLARAEPGTGCGSSQVQQPRLHLLPELPSPRPVTHPLLVVGDDTADEAGVGVAERGHEAAQGLLVELAHGPEHAPAGTAARRAVPEAAHLLQPHDTLHCGKKESDRG